MKIFRGTDGDTAPASCECEKFGYPNKTTIGDVMYENTHFLTEEEAWRSIAKSVQASVLMAGIELNWEQRHLNKATVDVATAAANFATAMDGHNKFFTALEQQQQKQIAALEKERDELKAKVIEAATGGVFTLNSEPEEKCDWNFWQEASLCQK